MVNLRIPTPLSCDQYPMAWDILENQSILHSEIFSIAMRRNSKWNPRLFIYFSWYLCLQIIIHEGSFADAWISSKAGSALSCYKRKYKSSTTVGSAAQNFVSWFVIDLKNKYIILPPQFDGLNGSTLVHHVKSNWTKRNQIEYTYRRIFCNPIGNAFW